MRRAGMIAMAALVLVTGVYAQQAEGGGQASVNAATESIPVIPGVIDIKGPNRGETRIAREVRHELLMLPYYSLFDDIRYRVNGSTVDLLGDVVRPSLKGDAEGAVKRIEGVEKVNNQINILPPSTADQRIRE